jgi:probable F420-dependent oxidoreductase
MNAVESPLRLGVKIAQDAPIESFREVWRIADEGGFDHCWGFDHMSSVGPIGRDRPVFDSWTMLGAMAVTTRRVRMGVLVTGMGYRNPALLAKIAVTVDHLSGGRLEFGIGAGWAVDEYRMYGIDGLPHRVGRLSETLRIVKSLWTEDGSDFAGAHYTLTDAVAWPKPVQRPHPPIWVGAAGPMTLKVAARHADVWNLVGEAGTTPDAGYASRAVKQFEQACTDVGRDPAAIRRSIQLRYDGGGVSALLDDLAQFRALGFTEIVIYVGGDDPVRAATDLAESMALLRQG